MAFPIKDLSADQLISNREVYPANLLISLQVRESMPICGPTADPLGLKTDL